MSKKDLAKKSSGQPNPNLKEQNAKHSFRIVLRDTDHFYKVVNWLNQNVGKGTGCWTMEGSPLSRIRNGESPNIRVYIFKDNFDGSSALYLSLL
jgi:hypothetical protein